MTGANQPRLTVERRALTRYFKGSQGYYPPFRKAQNVIELLGGVHTDGECCRREFINHLYLRCIASNLLYFRPHTHNRSAFSRIWRFAGEITPRAILPGAGGFIRLKQRQVAPGGVRARDA